MEQGSTPDVNAGGQQPSLPSSADNAGVSQPSQQPVQPPSEPRNGDLLGGLQQRIDQGQTDTGSSAPSHQPSEEPTPQTDPQNPGPAPAGDSVDEDLKRWAASQGYSLSTDSEVKLAKRLRDTQRAFHERNSNQQFQQTQQIVSDPGADPLESKVQTLEAQIARRDFWEQHSEDRALEPEMTAYVLDLAKKYEDTGDESYRAGAQFYMTPAGWDSLLKTIKAEKYNPGEIRDEAAETARRDEREALARAQQAAAPTAAATSSAPPKALSQDEQIANMSQAEYNEWRKTHNPFAA